MTKCPYCAEEIHNGISKCPHCGEELENKKIKPWYRKWWGKFIIVYIGLSVIGLYVMISEGDIMSNKSKSSSSYNKPNKQKSAQDLTDKLWREGYNYGVGLRNDGYRIGFTPCNNYAKRHKAKNMDTYLLAACLQGFADSK